MKILLLNSPWINNDTEYCVKAGTRWAAIRKKDRSMPYFPFPYFMASATAVLKAAGFDAHIKDAVAEEMSAGACLDYVRQMKPDLLVIEAFTPSIYEDLSFMQAAKSATGCRSAFCGVHPTVLCADILSNDFMDFVLLGEYDYTLRDLVSALSGSAPGLKDIAGLAFKESGRIQVNQAREPIKDLDELAFPERGELPMKKYSEPFGTLHPNTKIVTSRGCPYNCIFCTEPLMYSKPGYRKRSVRLVMEEIKIVQKEYGVKEVFFDDPIFTIERAKEIARSIIESGIKIAWSCWMDWNISFDDLKLLKESGCIGIKFGIESSSPEILKASRKPLDLARINELTSNCRKLGLLRHASFMFGLPGETKQSLKDTIDLAFSLDFTSCQLAIATPLPGTPFFRMADEKGWLVTRDWRKYECHYSAVVEYPGCSKEDIEAAIEEARERKVRQLLKNPVVAARYAFKVLRQKGLKGFMKEAGGKARFALKALRRAR